MIVNQAKFCTRMLVDTGRVLENSRMKEWADENAQFVSVNFSSRRLRYAISSEISLTMPSSLRISVSRPESDSWLAIALGKKKDDEWASGGNKTRTRTCSPQRQRQCQRRGQQPSSCSAYEHKERLLFN